MNAPLKVSLFVTCLTDLFAPQVGMSVVKVLEHFGCSVDFPVAQTCCGQPQFNNGYFAETRELAQRLITVFSDTDYVVTPSGSCCAMIRDHFPTLFQIDPLWRPRAEAFAQKTYEFVEFLTKVLRVDVSHLALPQKTAATYHFTCHLRGLNTTGQPAITLLKQLQNCAFVPLDKSEQCCGFGGTFATKYPDISGAIVKDKVACGTQSGADVMIVNDAGCAMNIGGACHRHHAPFAVKHLAELLASALENAPSPAGAPQ